MMIGPVPLRCSAECRAAWLRELSGHDEEAVDGTGTAAALTLLDRLLGGGQQGRADPAVASQLAAADRDRLLAALYVDTYGPDIRTTARCRHCAAPFDVEFSLSDLIESLDEEWEAGLASRLATEVPGAPGVYRLADGRMFRLPNGADELAVAGQGAAQAERELLERCMLEGDPGEDPALVEAAMRQVGPLIDRDLDVTCPECGAAQAVHFEVQFYLLRALMQERSRLTREVHRLALAYGWRMDEILSLPRRTRHRYAALVEAEAPFDRRRPA
jgi:hypothetical protein